MKDKPKVTVKKAVRHGRVAAPAISGNAKLATKSSATTAKVPAQKEKNETEKHSPHNHAGTESHKTVYDSKTGGYKAEPDDTTADAHNPHKHAGIASYRLSRDAKSGAHKALAEDAKLAAPKTPAHTGMKAKKKAGSKKSGAPVPVKNGFVADIEENTRKNKDFRRVLYTGEHCQFVLMCLKPMEDIGMETHDHVDQFFRFEEGQGSVVINGKKHAVKGGGGVIVPCGAEHNVICSVENLNDEKL